MSLPKPCPPELATFQRRTPIRPLTNLRERLDAICAEIITAVEEEGVWDAETEEVHPLLPYLAELLTAGTAIRTLAAYRKALSLTLDNERSANEH